MKNYIIKKIVKGFKEKRRWGQGERRLILRPDLNSST